MKKTLILLAGLLLAAPWARAEAVHPFTLKMSQAGSAASPGDITFSIENESYEPIVGLSIQKDSAGAAPAFKYLTKKDGLDGAIVDAPTGTPSSDKGFLVWAYTSNGVAYAGYSPRTITSGSFSTRENSAPQRNWLWDNESWKFEGYLTIQQTGNYEFRIECDDGGSIAYKRSPGADLTTIVERSSNGNRNSDDWLPFNAGDVIYLVATVTDTGGDDHLRVKWKRQGTDGHKDIAASDFSLEAPGWPSLQAGGSTSSHTIFIHNIPVPGSGEDQTISFSTGLQTQMKMTEELWNLPQERAKTIVTVYGLYGSKEQLVLGETLSNAIGSGKEYTFQSVNRPFSLAVKTVNAADGVSPVDRACYMVAVQDPGIPWQAQDTQDPVFSMLNHDDGAPIYFFDATGTNALDNKVTDLNRWNGGLYTPTGTFKTSRQLELDAVNPSVTVKRLRKDVKVSMIVVPEIYFAEGGTQLLYTSTSPAANDTAVRRGVDRYVANGVLVNNTAETGDEMRYNMTLAGDTKIDIRLLHQYALDVASDFSTTMSELKQEGGAAWAGPVESAATGDPSPAAGDIHKEGAYRSWITAGEAVSPTIAAEVQDYNKCSSLLYTRYLPWCYVGSGAARGSVPPGTVATNLFPAPFLVNERQQFNFTMSGPGAITYLWKIQFGVYAQTSDTDTSTVRVQRRAGSGAPWQTCDPVGSIYWFDQADNVRVLAQANTGGIASKALAGWTLGDAYYFSPATGSINTDTGEPGAPLNTDALQRPVASWIAQDTIKGTAYRGLEISRLLRPAVVTWNYGMQFLYDPDRKLGEYMFQSRFDEIEANHPDAVPLLFSEPSKIEPAGSAVWDPNAKVLFPIKPVDITVTYTNQSATEGMKVLISAKFPAQTHYRHVAETPAVQLVPEAGGSFQFVKLEYYENADNPPVIQNNSEFTASVSGRSVLRFREVRQVGRGTPKEYVAVRTVQTKTIEEWLDDKSNARRTAIIGQRITDPYDRAGFNTGYVFYQTGVRYNPSIYSSDALIALRAEAIYDMAKLKALRPEKVIVNPAALPGPVIPVNEYPDSVSNNQRITVVWYDDPNLTDGILWPYAARAYDVRWPTSPEEGLNRIVIASEWGSESIDTNGFDQVIAFPTGALAAAHTFDPARFTELKVYSEVNATGYNPNEEHALLAPSLRYAAVSPRPQAVYALRTGDLNNYGGTKTSPPYVLVQFYDNVLQTYDMRVFFITPEDKQFVSHSFAKQEWCTNNVALGMSVATAAQLQGEPHKTMEAGEPVIAFYPIGVVEGAVPCPESTGENLRGQATFWKDHKYTRWAVSGGTNAWFSVKAFYPLQPDFWWPSRLTGATLLDGNPVLPQVGASVAFLPPNLTTQKLIPTKILYKSDWPRIAPILKAGETITYSGGEYRADHPTMVVPTADGTGTETIQTPGLPAVVAFAVGEVVFDDLNPLNEEHKLLTDWTLRVAQVMDSRNVPLASENYPDILQPANGKTRTYKGKYYFNELPASLQKRVRYDPVTQQLELRGILNEKTTDDSTLTASPAAVYALEPNILTAADVTALKALAGDGETEWRAAVDALRALSLNPEGTCLVNDNAYAVGLQPRVIRDEYGIASNRMVNGFLQTATDTDHVENVRAFGTGLAAIPNGKFLDPDSAYPDVSWVTVAENNDPSMGGSPVTLHIIKVDRRERYRGSIKVITSDNVFDENVILKHTGDFGANGGELVYEWWYRPDDGALNVPPPSDTATATRYGWKLFPDLTGAGGTGRNEVLLKGDPNAPETLIADSWWYVRYRHIKDDQISGTDWGLPRPQAPANPVNYDWAGAGNSDPFHDYDLDGVMDYKAQLSMGWIKRVIDAVNPYEARIADFTGDSPATGSSMLQQLGPRFEGAVALNPDKDVVENVGLIELYQTILNRASDLSINLSTPVSTPAIANALQLASTRLSDFYMLLGNEAYVDAKDPTIGYGSDSVEYGAMAPVVHAFQNQTSSLLEEELDLLRGQDDGMARPVYNRLFWNFTKGEGEAAYAMNYNISDVNLDGFIDEDDAMILYPQGHGDAWGHYLTALTQQYNLLRHPYFNWVSRSEFYNLMDVVMKVDFLDERKFAQVAAQKAKAGAEIVANTYRENYTEDATAQWQGYTDVNADRAWGVQDWARRAGQGAYFDWITANALLPAEHPNTTLSGVQKVDRKENADIRVISANLNTIQTTLDNADSGLNPLGVSRTGVPFDINPYSWEDGLFGRTHFEQIYDRAAAALANAQTAWDAANAAQNRLRAIANTEQQFRNDVWQQDITYRNELIEIFGRPYPGTVGSGKFYPDAYNGPDLAYYMYVPANSTAYEYFPKPLATAVEFNDKGELSGGSLFNVLQDSQLTQDGGYTFMLKTTEYLNQISMLFGGLKGDTEAVDLARSFDGLYDMSSNDFNATNNPLEDLGFELPVTASTYSLRAPAEWGDRPASGELQQIIADMLQEQIGISATFGSYQDMFLDLIRAINLLEIQRQIDDRIAKRNQDLFISKSVINTILVGIKTTLEILEEVQETVEGTIDAANESIPTVLPTGGVAVSPGDALAPVRGTLKFTSFAVSEGLGAAGVAAKIIEFANEALWEITEGSVELLNADDERLKSYIEGIAGLDDMLDDEGDMRAEIFSRAELLRSLVEQYRTALSRGAALIDEREAFNRRVAAMTQQNRYQDMAFRVERNHALQNYNRLLDIAARYVYLAAKAYDYETNLSETDPGSPAALFEQIVKARSLGRLDGSGAPQLGDGLAGALAQLSANYDVLKNRLGLTNPQVETGKLSLRTENFRVFPSGYANTSGGATAGWTGENDADDNWRQILQKARVADLWTVPEYRYRARPFADSHQTEPGIVLRFSTAVESGLNVFGKPLAGGDHAYDPSVYATRIRSVGVWFSGYLAEDVLTDLSATPRVYLLPTGADIMSVPNAPSPTQTRIWNVVDQVVPVPVPGIESQLDYVSFIPLLDSLDGQFGQQRRFSSFRAYHDSGAEAVAVDELVRDSRLVGRSVWNTGWTLIIPGRALNADPDEGLNRFIENVSDIKLVFETYGFSGN